MLLLNENYPVYSPIDVYYNRYNASDVRLTLKDDESFFIAFWTLLGIIFTALIVWGSIELAYFIRKRYRPGYNTL